jgi:hypothetical protein
MHVETTGDVINSYMNMRVAKTMPSEHPLGASAKSGHCRASSNANEYRRKMGGKIEVVTRVALDCNLLLLWSCWSVHYANDDDLLIHLSGNLLVRSWRTTSIGSKPIVATFGANAVNGNATTHTKIAWSKDSADVEDDVDDAEEHRR